MFLGQTFFVPEKKIVSLNKTSFKILWSEVWKGGFQLMLILGLLGMNFDAVVVFVTSQTLFLRLALAILWKTGFFVVIWPKKTVSLNKTSFKILWSEVWKGGFQLMLILDPKNVFKIFRNFNPLTSSLLFRLAVAILCPVSLLICNHFSPTWKTVRTSGFWNF